MLIEESRIFTKYRSREGDRGLVPGPDPEARGQLHGPAGISSVPRGRGWHRLRARVLAAGAALRGLREEIEARIHGLPIPSSLERSRGALQ